MLKIETIAKNFNIFCVLQVCICVYAYRMLCACDTYTRNGCLLFHIKGRFANFIGNDEPPVKVLSGCHSNQLVSMVQQQT